MAAKTDAQTDALTDAEAKRQRAGTAPASAQPQTWPTSVHLYAEGLARRAEAETTNAAGWALAGRQLRASAFAAADADGSQLRQRQAEIRRQLLRKPAAG